MSIKLQKKTLKSSENFIMKGVISKIIVLVFFSFLIFLGFSSEVTASPPACPDCYVWSGSECVWYCGELVCCENDECCTCCGDECCDDSTQTCCGGECCNDSTEGCCGNELCCNLNQVCCQYLLGGYYCSPPCWDEVIDSTTCSKEHEEDHACPGCTVGVVPPTCLDFTYRAYSGLKQKQCHDGCINTDWNTSDAVCYETKQCGGQLKDDEVCLECEGELSCFGLHYEDEVCFYGDGTAGCLIGIACDVLVCCFDCENSSEVIDTYTKEHCECD